MVSSMPPQITMGCGDACPVVPGRHIEKIDWPLADPKHMSLDDARNVRDDAALRVSHLIKERGWQKAS